MPRRLLAIVSGLCLLAGTVLVFRTFDAHSHSASDTLRPFLLTVGPLWVAAAVAARALVRR